MGVIHGPDGTAVNVSMENRLLAVCVTESKEHHTNVHEGEVYSWQFSEDADANDDCIFYLKNEDDKDLILEGMDIFVTSDCDVYLKLGGSGTINSSSTAITGTNLNAGSGNVADVTCEKDGDIESGGTFTGATECMRYVYEAGTLVDTHHVNFPTDLVIPKNQVFTIWSDTAAVVIKGTLYGFFHEKR